MSIKSFLKKQKDIDKVYMVNYNVSTRYKCKKYQCTTQERRTFMSKDEKKEEIIKMAEQFMNIKSEEGKALAIMAISAYVEGRAVGRKEKEQMSV